MDELLKPGEKWQLKKIEKMVGRLSHLIYILPEMKCYIKHQIMPEIEPVNVQWVGDASTSYGIGIAVGEYWAKFKYKQGWESNGLQQNDPKRKIAWAETVAVRLGLLLLHHLLPTSGKRFVVWTDNTTTEGVFPKE